MKHICRLSLLYLDQYTTPMCGSSLDREGSPCYWGTGHADFREHDRATDMDGAATAVMSIVVIIKISFGTYGTLTVLATEAIDVKQNKKKHIQIASSDNNVNPIRTGLFLAG